MVNIHNIKTVSLSTGGTLPNITDALRLEYPQTTVKLFEVNDWDMSTESPRDILHGFNEAERLSIVSVDVIVYNDIIGALTYVFPASFVAGGGSWGITETQLRLFGSSFSGGDYSATTGLRARVKIEYLKQ